MNAPSLAPFGSTIHTYTYTNHSHEHNVAICAYPVFTFAFRALTSRASRLVALEDQNRNQLVIKKVPCCPLGVSLGASGPRLCVSSPPHSCRFSAFPRPHLSSPRVSRKINGLLLLLSPEKGLWEFHRSYSPACFLLPLPPPVAISAPFLFLPFPFSHSGDFVHFEQCFCVCVKNEPLNGGFLSEVPKMRC